MEIVGVGVAEGGAAGLAVLRPECGGGFVGVFDADGVLTGVETLGPQWSMFPVEGGGAAREDDERSAMMERLNAWWEKRKEDMMVGTLDLDKGSACKAASYSKKDATSEFDTPP